MEMDLDSSWAPFCRACLSTEALMPLRGPPEDLRPRFERVTSIEISDDDQLPAHLCNSCLDTVESIIKFKEQCLVIDKKLKRLQNPADSPENNEDDITIKMEEIPQESDLNEEDLYVIVVEPNERFVKAKQKSTKSAISLIRKDIPKNIDYSSDIHVNNSEQCQIQNNSMDDKITYDSSHSKNNVFIEELPIEFGDNIGADGVDVADILTDDSVVANNNIIKLDSSTSLDTVFNSGLTVEDGVTYSEEEIIVTNGDDTYEIINCDISELNIDNLNKQDQKIIWQENLSSVYNEELLDYDENCSKVNSLSCLACGKEFESKEILSEHLLTHEQTNTNISCPFCNKKIKRGFLTYHITANHKSKASCSICKKTFATTHNRKRHMLTHLASKGFECDVCQLQFTQKTALKNHQLIHGFTKKYTCDECHKEFLLENVYKEHILKCENTLVKIAIADRTQNLCIQCGKTYSTPEALENHIQADHTGQSENLLCPECGIVLSSRRAMMSHLSVHRSKLTNKKFSCSVCGKGFSGDAMLKMHERVHTNERPYECKKCSFAFKTKTHLTTHQLTHTQIKNFSCQVCKKSFSLKGNLVVHMRTHTGERPYVCNLCNQAFIDSKYLKKHKARRHGIDSKVTSW